jgi:hypothetical protein
LSCGIVIKLMFTSAVSFSSGHTGDSPITRAHGNSDGRCHGNELVGACWRRTAGGGAAGALGQKEGAKMVPEVRVDETVEEEVDTESHRLHITRYNLCDYCIVKSYIAHR